MAIESVTYISDFNRLYPTSGPGGDHYATADDHLRNIKIGVLDTFPSITGPVTTTQAELNVLDGITSTVGELNILDGATLTVAELNTLDGITSTVAELNVLDGITSTVAELNVLDGITSTVTELNKLDGFTGVVADLNILSGAQAAGVTAAELVYVAGVTSDIQTQLDAKPGLATDATISGTYRFTADVQMDNQEYLLGWNFADDTLLSLIGVGPSNVTAVGNVYQDATFSVLDTLSVIGGDIRIDNNESMLSQNAAGSATIPMIGVNSSDVVIVSNAFVTTQIAGSSIILTRTPVVNSIATDYTGTVRYNGTDLASDASYNNSMYMTGSALDSDTINGTLGVTANSATQGWTYTPDTDVIVTVDMSALNQDTNGAEWAVMIGGVRNTAPNGQTAANRRAYVYVTALDGASQGALSANFRMASGEVLWLCSDATAQADTTCYINITARRATL